MMRFALGFCAAVLIAAPLETDAQTMRNVLTRYRLTAPDSAGDLDQIAASFALLDDDDVFVMAHHPRKPGSSALAETVHVRVLDRRRGTWRHAALPTAREVQREVQTTGWQLGSISEVLRANGYLYLQTHHNPSASTTLVLDQDLQPVAALNGWTEFLFADGAAIYQHNAPHVAPTHAAELSLFDPVRRETRPLYPVAPYASVRAQFIDEVARIYRGMGDSWFREHNHHMDASRFDSSVGDVFVANASGDVAFVVRFGRDASEPETPVFDVVVHCNFIRQFRSARKRDWRTSAAPTRVRPTVPSSSSWLRAADAAAGWGPLVEKAQWQVPEPESVKV